MATFTKDVAQPDQAGAEAAGLRWLHQAVPEAVVEVVEVGQSYLRTERVEPAAPHGGGGARIRPAPAPNPCRRGRGLWLPACGLGGQELHRPRRTGLHPE